MEGFGGFTVNPWQSNDRGEYSTSNGDKAWLFSLNNTTGHPIRLKCIRHCNVQCHATKYGPIFGGVMIYVLATTRTWAIILSVTWVMLT